VTGKANQVSDYLKVPGWRSCQVERALLASMDGKGAADFGTAGSRALPNRECRPKTCADIRFLRCISRDLDL